MLQLCVRANNSYALVPFRNYKFLHQTKKLVRNFSSCINIKSSPTKAFLHPRKEQDSNWQRVYIDYAGPFQEHHFLVVDAKSKWAEIVPCAWAPTLSSSIDLLQDIFARNGFSEVLVSGSAPIFTSGEFQEFCKKAGIFCKFNAPGHSATNGLAERNVQTLKKQLTAMISEPKTMRKKVQEILFRYRSTPLINGKTPAEQFLLRQIRMHLDVLKPIKFQQSQESLSLAWQLNMGKRV